jgi:hypothetical protein
LRVVHEQEHLMRKTSPRNRSKASVLISSYIEELGDWRGVTLAKLREVILQASPAVAEGWKWGAPVWEANGLVCVAGAFKGHVKITFARGASLKDPGRLFNASLEGRAWRAIDFHQGDTIDAAGVKGLVRDAVALNTVAARR